MKNMRSPAFPQFLKHVKISLKAVFHCSRFARADGATDFNLVKNELRGHAKKVVHAKKHVL